MRKILVYILFFPVLAFAQDAYMDSLKLAFNNAKHDTVKIKLLNELSEICEINDILSYAEPCENLCNKALKTKPGNAFYLKHLSDAINNIGFVAEQQGESYKALECYTKSLAIRESQNDLEGMAASYNNIGVIHKNFGNIPKALDYYHKCLSISEKLKDKNMIALALDNIAAIFSSQQDYQKALEYYNRALKLYTETGEKSGVALALNNIGYVYHNLKNTDKSLEYYTKSLRLHEEVNEKQGITASLNNIGLIYSEKGDYNKALEIYHRSLKIYESMSEKSGITHSLNHIANAYLRLDKLTEALVAGKRAFKLSNELGYPKDITTSAATLKRIYKKQKNYKEAFAMYQLQIVMQDSMNNKKTKNATIKKQLQYEYEKKAAADSVKRAEEQKVNNALLIAQQAQLKQEKTQRMALYGGLVLVIIFLSFVFNRYRITQKQKAIIEQQKVQVDNAYAQLHEKNREVLDSITYARRIQKALITSEHYIEKSLNRLNKN